MADIKTFTAIRPKQELVAQIAALPYDVYSRAEAREAVQGHPILFYVLIVRRHNFLRIVICMHQRYMRRRQGYCRI